MGDNANSGIRVAVASCSTLLTLFYPWWRAVYALACPEVLSFVVASCGSYILAAWSVAPGRPVVYVGGKHCVSFCLFFWLSPAIFGCAFVSRCHVHWALPITANIVYVSHALKHRRACPCRGAKKYRNEAVRLTYGWWPGPGRFPE